MNSHQRQVQINMNNLSMILGQKVGSGRSSPLIRDFIEITERHRTALTPIAPPYFYLTQTGASEETRFGVRFVAVWQQVPAEDRKVVEEYLQKAHILPRIYLVPKLGQDRGASIEGRYRIKEIVFEFSEPFVKKMPDNVLDVLIAHELAHFYCEAVGLLSEDEHACEDTANAAVKKWKFDLEALRSWEKSNNPPSGKIGIEPSIGNSSVPTANSLP